MNQESEASVENRKEKSMRERIAEDIAEQARRVNENASVEKAKDTIIVAWCQKCEEITLKIKGIEQDKPIAFERINAEDHIGWWARFPYPSENERRKEIESVYCADCQKSMKLINFPNGVKNWYECEDSAHSVIVYLSEDERRIEKELILKKIEERITHLKAELRFDLSAEYETNLKTRINELNIISRFLQEQDTP